MTVSAGEVKAGAAGEQTAAVVQGDSEMARQLAALESGEDLDGVTDEVEAEATTDGTDATEEAKPKSDNDKQAEAEDGEKAKEKPEAEEWHGVPPEVQAKFEKRLGKEVARRKELEEQLESERTYTKQMKQEAEERARVSPVSDNPLLAVESEAELDAREDKLMEMVEWCEDHPEGYEGKGTEADPGLTADEIREKAHAFRKMLRAIPRARQALTKRQAFEGTVREVYPDLMDSRSDMAAEAGRLLAAVPGLRALPDYKLRIGDMIAGRAARNQKSSPPSSREGLRRGDSTGVKSKVPAAPGAPVASAAVTGKATGTRKSGVEIMAEVGFDETGLTEAFTRGARK